MTWRATLACLALAFWLSVLGAELLDLLVRVLGEPGSMNRTFFA